MFSCCFCKSNLHLSQFCHKTRRLKIRIATSKRLFQKFNNATNLLCYTCYSREHHTYFCNVKAPQLCIPLIDEILLQRFMQMFDPVEKIQFAFYLNSQSHLKHVTVLCEPTNEYKNIFLQTDAIIYNFPTFEENGRFLLDTVEPKMLYIYSNIIILRHLQLTSDEFFSLLSVNTIELNCYFVTVIPDIKFSEILFKIKNIEKIDFHEFNIITEKTWPKLLLKYLNTNLFRNLQITINDADFEIQPLIKFMKQNKMINVSLNIDIRLPLQEVKKILNNKFDQRFKRIEKVYMYGQKRSINIKFTERKEDMMKIIHFLGNFAL